MQLAPTFLPTPATMADSGLPAVTPAELEMGLTYCSAAAVLAQHGKLCSLRQEPMSCQHCGLYRCLRSGALVLQ